jgi:hypothetical protein
MPVFVKPQVFISSTIYDFQDLRSALKYWLGELGYEVLLSEYSDFPKAPDENSYESCLNAIKSADYFLLLIGGRVGGWFDKNARVSITRMEYRAAYDHFVSTGRPKPLVFVRQNLWDVREDRAALAQFLQEERAASFELSDEAKARIKAHPSKFVNDAQAIFEFVTEVGQVQLMKQAITGGAGLPKGNWIHRFNAFSDIVDALRVAFGVSNHVERRILLENLRQELMRNLTRLVTHIKPGLMPIARWGTSVAEKMNSAWDESTDLTVGDLTRLGIFRLSAAGVPARLTDLYLQQASQTGIFMRFVPETGAYVGENAHEAILELLSRHEEARRQQNVTSAMYEFIDGYRPEGRPRETKVRVDNRKISMVCSNALLISRITDLTIGLLKWLGGDRSALSQAGQPWFPSPYKDEIPKLEAEQVTISDIEQWLKQGN